MAADRAATAAAGDLAVLGLSAAEETAYRILVRRGAGTLADVEAEWRGAAAAGVAAAAAAGADAAAPDNATAGADAAAGDAVQRLVRRGLAYRLPGRPAPYAAVSPRMAFDSALADQGQRLRTAREHAEQLARAYRSPGWITESDVVEVVTGRLVVAERLSRALRSTRVELRSVVVQPAARCELVDAERELRSRAVATRVLSGADAGCDADGDPATGHWRRTGDPVPASIHLVDDRLGLVLTDDRHATAVLVHPCELLAVLSLLFETLWERAGPPPDDTETEHLVELLLSGLTDEGIGRALGVSPRTAQRRVAAMMQAAGARTRFQAGVQAALRR